MEFKILEMQRYVDHQSAIILDRNALVTELRSKSDDQVTTIAELRSKKVECSDIVEMRPAIRHGMPSRLNIYRSGIGATICRALKHQSPKFCLTPIRPGSYMPIKSVGKSCGVAA